MVGLRRGRRLSGHRTEPTPMSCLVQLLRIECWRSTFRGNLFGAEKRTKNNKIKRRKVVMQESKRNFGEPSWRTKGIARFLWIFSAIGCVGWLGLLMKTSSRSSEKEAKEKCNNLHRFQHLLKAWCQLWPKCDSLIEIFIALWHFICKTCSCRNFSSFPSSIRG